MLAGGRSATGMAGLELQRCLASLKQPAVEAVAATPHAAGVGGHAVDSVAVVDRISAGEYGLGAGAVRVASEERLSTRVARDVVVPTNVDAVAVWHLRSLLFSRLFCWLRCPLLTSGTMPRQLRASPQA